MLDLVWLIPAIMFAAALINGLGCRRLGALAGHIAWGSMAACCLISFAILFAVIGEARADITWTGHTVVLWNWIDIPNLFGPDRHFVIDMAFRVDQLTAVFLCFVSFIGTLVFIYATGYMKEKHGGELELDPGYARFFCYVSLFAASMFILVLGANLAVMFIGWEGVGLCSYLLIGYFYDKRFSDKLSCADAGRKAFVVNRIGDAGLIVGMGLLFWGLGTVDFLEIDKALMTGTLANGQAIPAGFMLGGALITAATLCMFLGATGKSAQIPLFTWLPDAMAGPTPVSALIHAATMVTAGVYMIARLNVPFFLSPTTLMVVAIIGGLTALVAASIGLTQRGIKKVLAYSTVSQLGYMFLGLGVGAMSAGIFHVFTHAFFKGCLFLAAGSVIYAMHHEEDMYKMGGLKKYMPKTWLAYLFGTLAIVGIPLTSGFFSKDEILFFAFLGSGDGLPVLWILGVVTAALTAIYMGRSLFLTFHGEERMDEKTRSHLHESPTNMTAPILVLGALGLVVGFLNVPASLNPGFLPDATFHKFIQPVVDKGANHVAFLKYGFEADLAAGQYAYGTLVLADAATPEQPHLLKLTDEQKRTELLLAVFSGGLAIVGLAIAWFFFGAGITERARRMGSALRPLWLVSWKGWWWDDIYDSVFQRGTWKLSIGTWRFDAVIVDGVVNGSGKACALLGSWFRRLQSGQVQTYGLIMVAGAVAFLLYFAAGTANFLQTVVLRDTTPPEALEIDPRDPPIGDDTAELEISAGPDAADGATN